MEHTAELIAGRTEGREKCLFCFCDLLAALSGRGCAGKDQRKARTNKADEYFIMISSSTRFACFKLKGTDADRGAVPTNRL